MTSKSFVENIEKIHFQGLQGVNLKVVQLSTDEHSSDSWGRQVTCSGRM